MTGPCMSEAIVPQAFTTLDPGADKRQVIAALAGSLAQAGAIPATALTAIIDGALRRESVGSTGIGHGIGIPHCRTTAVDRIVCGFGHCADGLDFDSLDGEPVFSVFLLVTPLDQRDQHLLLMRSFATQIRREHFCSFLHQASSAEALTDLLAEFAAR
jgi:nitrogen PTS system EIIA component